MNMTSFCFWVSYPCKIPSLLQSGLQNHLPSETHKSIDDDCKIANTKLNRIECNEGMVKLYGKPKLTAYEPNSMLWIQISHI